jgi:hypothetical protein
MSEGLNKRQFLTGLIAAAGLRVVDPSSAFAARKKKRRKKQRASAGPKPHFTAIPTEAANGPQPLQLIISLKQQQMHVYSGTKLIGKGPVSSGRPGNNTPQGIFTIMEKYRKHRSNIYSNAPMPYMQRLTWSGIALHEGRLPGYAASHGCVRLPGGFAKNLFKLNTRNRHVIITEDMPEPTHIAPGQGPFTRSEENLASLANDDVATDALARRQSLPVRIYLTRLSARDHLSDAQAMLTRLGFYGAEVDGLMGRKTWRAIADFQKAIGMRKRNGLLTPNTLRLIEAAFGVEPRPDGHLYVRQGQNKVFDMPVTLINPDEPLGTHLMTAGEVSPTSTDALWTAVTIEQAETGTALHAFNRFVLPDHARQRIEAMLTSFSSVAISGTGLGPETGKGTDFIVVTKPSGRR